MRNNPSPPKRMIEFKKAMFTCMILKKTLFELSPGWQYYFLFLNVACLNWTEYKKQPSPPKRMIIFRKAIFTWMMFKDFEWAVSWMAHLQNLSHALHLSLPADWTKDEKQPNPPKRMIEFRKAMFTCMMFKTLHVGCLLDCRPSFFFLMSPVTWANKKWETTQRHKKKDQSEKGDDEKGREEGRGGG